MPKTDTFGAGTLTLTVGVGDKAKTMNVQVEEGDTLTTVRNKIDAAGRKEGVQATLISSGDNQYLSIAQKDRRGQRDRWNTPAAIRSWAHWSAA